MIPRNLAFASAVLCTLLAIPAASPRPQEKGFATEGYPSAMVEAARLTEKRCTRCHNLKRITKAPHRGEAWASVVDQMVKKRRSRTTPAEGRRITEFLAFHTTKGRGGKSSSAAKKSEATLFPRRRYARLARVELGSDPLPRTLQLERYALRVESLREARSSKEDGARGMLLSGQLSDSKDEESAGRKLELSLAPDADGALRSSEHELRKWKVGPYAYRLILALDRQPDVNASPTLLLLVDRGGPASAGAAPAAGPVSFERSILPILQEHCSLCHDEEGEAELDLRSYEGLSKGGTSGALVVPGRPKQSLLMKRITGEIAPLMPEGGDPLPKQTLELVSRWIAEGARNN